MTNAELKKLVAALSAEVATLKSQPAPAPAPADTDTAAIDWNELKNLSYDEIIRISANRIIENREAGVTNPNINSNDIRYYLTTAQHQQLRRATWKVKNAKVTLADVRAALIAEVAKGPQAAPAPAPKGKAKAKKAAPAPAPVAEVDISAIVAAAVQHAIAAALPSVK